jgi:uncharacterized protein YndB with AHSA1/START domain
MTNHPIPYRFEVELEVAGTPDEVWHAIATPEGIGSWMLPTELEPYEGGALTFHMGPGAASHGQVTAFEPHRRIEYEEDWATLVGHPGADVTPLTTEFVVEARSGGTCVVRVVSSAFGSGADWEHEFWAEMSLGWAPVLDNLRLYMSHFRGEHATQLWASAACAGTAVTATGALRNALGIEGVTGEAFEARGLAGVVERSLDRHFLLRVERPLTGMLSFFSFDSGEGTMVQLLGYVFGDDPAGYVAREQQAWCDWLAAATAGVTADSSSA